MGRYLYPANHNLRTITKAGKDFSKRLDVTEIKFSVKIRDIHKIKKRILSQLAFLVMKQSMYQKIAVKKKHVDLLLIGEEGKIHYVLTKDFNTFMYDNTLHRRRKHFAVIVYKLSVQKKY